MSFNRIEHTGGAVVTTLSSDIASGDTSLVLISGTGWPTGGTGPFYLVIDQGLSGEEKILATARSSNSLTGLSRGVDGTSASAHTAGATIKHILSAAEADEANQIVHATLGAVTTKGDLTPATAAGALGRLAAGSDGLPLVAASGQTTGLQYAALTSSGIGAGAVTTTQILDGTIATGDIANLAITTALLNDTAVTTAKLTDTAVTTAKLAGSAVTKDKLANAALDQFTLVGGGGTVASWNASYSTFSGTTDSSGNLTVNHSAPFTPTVVLVTPHSPSTGGNIFAIGIVSAITATTFTLKCLKNDGTVENAVAVAGYFLALP